MADRAADFGVPIDDRFVLSVKAGPILHLRDVLTFKRIWRTGEFHIVHSHRSHDHTLAALAKNRQSSGKLVRTLFSERALSQKRTWQLKRADALVTVARGFRAALMDRGLAAPDRIVAIEGVVDPNVFRPGKGGEEIRIEANVPLDAPVAGIVARMKKGRGHRLLIDAWGKVHQRLPAAHLFIAGRGELTEELMRDVQQCAWGSSIHFLGYRKDLPEVYRSFDVKVLLAPGNDGTCRAAIEAMACGKPVVASAVGALSEIVHPGKNGLLVPAKNADALADALVNMLSDLEKSAGMGKAARHEAIRAHAIDRQSETLEAVYRRILKM
jgi:glycosyltransferase involved in cell wall biosynthesis